MKHLIEVLIDMKLIPLKLARRMLKNGAVVSLMCWEKSGQIRSYESVIVTSHRFHPDVINIMIQASREVRQVRTKLIFQINDMEVCL